MTAKKRSSGPVYSPPAATDADGTIPFKGNEWRATLRRNEEGNPTKDPSNAALILAHDARWQGCLSFDDFSCRVIWDKTPPSEELPGFSLPSRGDEIQDHHWLMVAHWLAKYAGGLRLSKQNVLDAMLLAARWRSRNVLQDYLHGLTWDGRARLPSWLSTHLGAAASQYTERVGVWWPLSAVARALRPGAQVDHMLVLEGPQGARKSTALRQLCPNDSWFLSKLPNLRDYNKAAHGIQGRWLCEVGELDALRGAAATQVKDFLTLTVDTYHAPYGHFHLTRPRTTVFAGTTNEEQYLQDPTGARRFWPLRCGIIDIAAISRDRDQLWAEAVVRYQQGEHWWPESPSDHAMFGAEQEARQEVDAWESKIAEWMAERDGVTTGEVLSSCFNMPPADWDRGEQTRVGACLRRLGYRMRRTQTLQVRERRYYRPTSGQG